MRTRRKLLPLAALTGVVRGLKRQGRRIVLTNGCFDLLHAGHLHVLERAKRLGDVLIVAMNSDRSIRLIKDSLRPIMPQRERGRLLASLACVDYVTIFGEPTPRKVIQALVPAILVKGADWPASQIVGKEAVQAAGGKVVTVPLLRGASTTSLIKRILDRYAPHRSTPRSGRNRPPQRPRRGRQ